jgi:hypothetical protein
MRPVAIVGMMGAVARVVSGDRAVAITVPVMVMAKAVVLMAGVGVGAVAQW